MHIFMLNFHQYDKQKTKSHLTYQWSSIKNNQALLKHCIRDDLFSALAMFFEELTFLPPVTHTYICMSGGKNVSFPENFTNVLKPCSDERQNGFQSLKLKPCKFLQRSFTPCELDCFCLKTLKHFRFKCLTLSWRWPLSYRSQSIDLRGKSMDWFLYDNGVRHERVKTVFKNQIF